MYENVIIKPIICALKIIKNSPQNQHIVTTAIVSIVIAIVIPYV